MARPTLSLSILLYLIVGLRLATALTLPELRHRSIYQVFTDRFARDDGQVPVCDPGDKDYCGGTWKGIEQNLAYIRGMGFDTSKWKKWIALTGVSLDLTNRCKRRA